MTEWVASLLGALGAPMAVHRREDGIEIMPVSAPEDSTRRLT